MVEARDLLVAAEELADQIRGLARYQEGKVTLSASEVERGLLRVALPYFLRENWELGGDESLDKLYSFTPKTEATETAEADKVVMVVKRMRR